MYDVDTVVDPPLTAFEARMHEAKRALATLDAVNKGSTVTTIATAAAQAKRAYKNLQRHQLTAAMTPEESARLQSAIDLIRARMKSLGRP